MNHSLSNYFLFLIFFNCSIVHLQCYDHLICIANWFSYTYIYIFFQIFFSYRLLQNVEFSSLCSTVGLCWLSILDIVVYICSLQKGRALLISILKDLSKRKISCHKRKGYWGPRRIRNALLFLEPRNHDRKPRKPSSALSFPCPSGDGKRLTSSYSNCRKLISSFRASTLASRSVLRR